MKARAAGAAGSDAGSAPGLRISRAFFERSLAGTVSFAKGDANKPLEHASDIVWREFPPSEPAPTGAVIADFRDHLGCAFFEQLGSLRLCFRIMGDVSSVGVNGEETSVEGLEGGVVPCAVVLSQLRFVRAVRDQERAALRVDYVARCGGSPVFITLELRQI